MTTMSPPSAFTADDVLTLEDEGLFELVDGKLIEKKMGYLSNKTAGLVTHAIQSHVMATQCGDVLPEQSFQCFPNRPEQIRRPDIAFISSSRTPSELPTGHVTIAPDIAIEVVSPSDRIYDLDEKIEDYHSAGVKLIWVVNPNSRTVVVHRPDRTVTILLENDTLVGESVLPGFAVKVADMLPAPTAHGATK